MYTCVHRYNCGIEYLCTFILEHIYDVQYKYLRLILRASAALIFQVEHLFIFTYIEHLFIFTYIHIHHILFKYLRDGVRASAPFSFSNRGFM